MKGLERARDALGVVAAGLLAAGIAALLLTLITGLRQTYLVHGFWHSLLLILQVRTWQLVPWGLGAAILLALAAAVRARAGGDGTKLLLRLLALAAGAGAFLALAEPVNRARFAAFWLQQRHLLGMPLPRALLRADVWGVNLLLALAGAAVGVGVDLLLQRWLGRRPARTAGIRRALRHPASWLVALLFPLAVGLGARAIHGAARFRPDIILVSIDTLRADRLRSLGYDRPATPFLDHLALDGVLFERCISPAPNTPPAHMSLFTSLYPTVHGFTGNADHLPDRRFTLTEYLREAGYRTFATTDGGYLRARVGFGQGFERFDDQRKGIAASVPQALGWIDHELRDQAYFIFLHCYDVHSPYDPPPPYRDLFTDPDYAGDFEPTAGALEAIRERMHRDPAAGNGLSPADVKYIGDRYDGGVRYADEWIGELVRGLQERGLLAHTWLIVTSDHGEEFTEHGSVLHEKLYHTVTRVPLVVRPPGGPGSVHRVPEIVELTDVLPTLLDIAGARPADRVQGKSLLGLINGYAPGWKNRAYSELPWNGRRRALTTDRYHILTSLDDGEVEVYDYVRDRLEQRPLPEQDWPPEIPGELARLRDWSRQQQEIAVEDGSPPVAAAPEPAQDRELRALGYIQ